MFVGDVLIKRGKTSLEFRQGLEFCYMGKGIPRNRRNSKDT